MTGQPSTLSPEIQQAWHETTEVLGEIRKIRLRAQTEGTLSALSTNLVLPGLFFRLEQAWRQVGHGPDRPLPEDLASLRTVKGGTVVDTLLDLSAASGDGWRWMEPVLDWALATKWSVWTPGVDGHSGVYQLLSMISDVPALCEKLDHHGVNWNARIGAPSPSLVVNESAIVLPVVPGDTLLVHAVVKAQDHLREVFWPLVEFLVPRTQDPWAALPPSDQTILDMADPEIRKRLLRLEGEEKARQRSEQAIQQAPSTPSRPRCRA